MRCCKTACEHAAEWFVLVQVGGLKNVVACVCSGHADQLSASELADNSDFQPLMTRAERDMLKSSIIPNKGSNE